MLMIGPESPKEAQPKARDYYAIERLNTVIIIMAYYL